MFHILPRIAEYPILQTYFERFIGNYVENASSECSKAERRVDMTHGYSIDQFDLQQNTISDTDHQAVGIEVAPMPRLYTGIGLPAQPVITFSYPDLR
jgi:hypothetical protein